MRLSVKYLIILSKYDSWMPLKYHSGISVNKEKAKAIKGDVNGRAKLVIQIQKIKKVNICDSFGYTSKLTDNEE
jgi:hypothetical protein